MIWIYLASLVFGSVFVVPLVLGGIGADADADFDTDTDFDSDFDSDFDGDFGGDFDGDVGGDVGGGPGGLGGSMGLVGDVVSSLVSFRSIMFFATFFGLTGTVLELLSYNAAVVATSAVSMGLLGAVTNSLAFSLLRRSQSSSHVSSAQMQGRRATVAVPIEPGRRGRIQIDLAGQPQYMVAVGIDGDEHLPRGHPVVVVAIDNGIAAVTSLQELDAGDTRPLLD